MAMKRTCLMPVLLGLLLPAQAQNLMETIDAVDPAGMPAKAQAELAEPPPALAMQHAASLAAAPPRQAAAAVATPAVLGAPTPYQLISTGRHGDVVTASEAVKQDLDLVSATYRELGRVEENCRQPALTLRQRVNEDASLLLEVIERELRANPSCACEIVKAAIAATEPDVNELVAIVETAIITAPETLRIVSQCAIAAMPESLSAIQALLARYDANAGETGSSAKSAKSGKDPVATVADDIAAIPNPLDFPGVGPVGPTSGGPGGQPLVPLNPPILITPPRVTEVDP
jgi:hypothetical protein